MWYDAVFPQNEWYLLLLDAIVANCIPEGDKLGLLRGRESGSRKERKRQNNKERPPLGNHPTAEKRTQHCHHPVHVLRTSIVTAIL